MPLPFTRKKPLEHEKAKPAWQPLSVSEIEETTLKLAKEGITSAKIGVILRDQYGVGNVKSATGKSITEILRAKGLAPKIPEDLRALIKRAVATAKHVEKNPRDYHNKRGLTLIESKIRSLVKYYKKEQVLPQDWEYSIESARIFVE
ncbi:MAG: 30S ribosomal protein S15 [Candidatus Thermoplasmatota archaeon]|nr:30S ribosomal protein S15 [Candidatus Thermoplasmatota archaeon]